MYLQTFKKIILLLLILLIPISGKAITFENPLGTTSFEELIDNFLNILFWIGAVISPVTILVAAFYLLTAGGDPAKISTGKRIIIWTIIGFVIILLARGISSLITEVLE